MFKVRGTSAYSRKIQIRIFAGMIFAVVLLLSHAASAVVIYQWHAISVSGPLESRPEFFNPTFIVSDEAYASGSLSFRRAQCGYESLGIPCLEKVGDASGFLSSSIPWEMPGLGILRIDVVFNEDGTMSGSIWQGGVFDDVQISGTGTDWSGFIGSDRFPSCSVPKCGVTGFWQQVPEPMTLVLFCAGLVGLAVSRRRQVAH